tara:strand:+ start:718 stop:969 length:252 start_codon:yes stop_codon:yes gene_type:complete
MSDFPEDDIKEMIELLNERIEELCEVEEQAILILTAVVVCILQTRNISPSIFASNLVSVHRNAMASMKEVEKLLKPFMRGNKK